MTKIAIVGAGWYGCHLAMVLKARGCDVTLIDEKTIFSGAASQNQLRLHLGYHYLRSHSTRQQAKSGFLEFMEKYGFLTTPITSNLYAVPFEGTLLDYDTVAQILDAEGLPHSPMAQDWNDWSLGFEAVFQTEERLIDAAKSVNYFLSELESNLVKSKITRIDFEKLVQENDFVIDASYSSLFFNYPGSIFEATLICEFEQTWGQNIFQGLTLVDGELWSIFPTGQTSQRSLSHVQISPVFQSTQEDEIRAYIESSRKLNFEVEIFAMREHVLKHVPSLIDSLDSLQVRFLTKKIKPNATSARRVSKVVLQDNVFYVEPGKIDAIFQVEREVIKSLTETGAV